MTRALRNFVKRRWKPAFELGQRLGVDVLPRHWYASVPDFRDLRGDDRWREPLDMLGIAGADLEDQTANLRQWMTDDRRDRLGRGDVWEDACDAVGERGYGLPDADALWGFFAEHRPPRVMQVGCGVSTHVMLRCAKESGFETSITCVDPYPSDYLRTVGVALIPDKAEHVDADRLADLGAGDLLFIDSTHATRPGSDVHHLYLRVLPRLKPGVLIHVHDIPFPYDFGPNILGPGDLFFGAEAVLLYAYLLHNPRCRLTCSLSMLHHARPSVLDDALPNYTPFPTDRGLNDPAHLGQSPSACYLVTQ